MINLGIQRTERLLQYVARDIFNQPTFNPPWKAIHIAGTNGKGSVAAYTSSLLRRCLVRKDGQPVRIGRFTSPHLIDRWDCITINDKPVSKEVFDKAEAKVLSLRDAVSRELRKEAEGNGVREEELRRISEPTQFELLTATAFTIFSMPDPTPCDIAVIECGLGGIEDATNALPDSAIDVSVLTRIGLDHLGLLGDGIGSIVRHKAGIARKGVKVVVDSSNEDDIVRLIKDTISGNLGYDNEQLDSVIKLAGPGTLQQLVTNVTAEEKESFGETCRALLPHQRSNLAIAQQAVKIMLGSFQGHSILEANTGRNRPNHAEALRFAVEDANTSYPARLQELQPGWLKTQDKHRYPQLNHHTLLLDGAHNAQSAEVLHEKVLSLLQLKAGNRSVIWILAMSSTKPPREILDALLCPRNTQGEADQVQHKVIFTSFCSVDGMPWVNPSKTKTLVEALKDIAENASIEIEGETQNLAEALAKAEILLAERVESEEDGHPLIVVAGSLYLASDFLRLVRDGKEAFEQYWQDKYNTSTVAG